MRRLVYFLVIPAILGSQCIAVSLSVRPPTVHWSDAKNSTAIRDESRDESVRLWEQAITAKGGRERLYSVHNMVISENQDYITHKGKKNRVRRERLFVFPNKYWFYDDYGSDVFGIDMHMYNYDTGLEYVGAPGNPETRLEPVIDRTKVPWLDNAPIFILLETKWLKPTFVKTSSENIGSKKVDVIETRLNGRRVDFALDRQTHLPVRVSFHNVNVTDNKMHTHVLRLGDYVNVNGIVVPQMLKLEDEDKRDSGGKQTVQFNVEYKESIFREPPSARLASPEAWRRNLKK
jgi:hypothetical protein